MVFLLESTIFFVLFTSFIAAQVGVWLKSANSSSSCQTVKGHFILDETVFQHRERLYLTYRNLKRIEGCLLVTGYTGLTNLSFLSQLEEVICDPKDALSSDLFNVIEISTARLTTMGLNSLKNVTGPENIIMQFNQPNEIPTDSLQVGEKCFSEQEMLFLAYHPQFIGYIYKACNWEDPCLAQDLTYLSLHLPRTTRAHDVPANCSIYYGSIIFTGWDTGKFANLHNLKLLIGKISITGTLLDDFRMFRSLQIVYNNDNSFYAYSLQLFEMTNVPFLANSSIPSLKALRPVRWIYQTESQLSSSTGVIERVKDPCLQMEQFWGENCEKIYVSSLRKQSNEELISYLYWEYLLTELITVLGILLNFRAFLMLISIQHGRLLPSSRYLLALIAALNCLVNLERAIAYQREVKVFYGDYRSGGPNFIYYMPTLQTSVLITPLLKWFSCVCVAFKHAALLLIPLCYLDYAIFFWYQAQFSVICAFRIKHRPVSKISSLLTTIGYVIFIFLSFYFYYQLFVFIKVGNLDVEEREFGKSAQYYIFLVLHEEGRQSADLLGGIERTDTEFLSSQFERTQYNNYFSTIRDFVDLVPDSLGIFMIFLVQKAKQSFSFFQLGFSSFLLFADIVTALVSILFYIFYSSGRIVSGHNFLIFLLLYFDLSSSRLRWYLRNDVIFEGYCPKEQGEFIRSICGTDSPYNWGVMKLLEKIPYILAVLSSILAWKFAKFHLFLGAAIFLKKDNLQRRRAAEDAIETH